MTTEQFVFFTLVPQTDRRQLSDRRTFWRGGRRAADVVTRDESMSEAASGAAALWGGSTQVPPSKVEKLRLH